MNVVKQTQPATLREAFRNYFSSTFRNDGEELNCPANNHMQQVIISAADVHWQLTHLNSNKSEGANEIHPIALASLAPFLATPSAKLYNNSIANGKISVEWKSSVICPIYKKGCENNVSNYRPICLTSVICKIRRYL